MSQDLIAFCPVCSNKLFASRLSCRHCGLELSKDFSLSKFNYLKSDELEFIEIYLSCSGNLKELQTQMNLSYPAAKKKFDQILSALGYLSNHEEDIEVILTEVPIYNDESASVKSIKQKLNEQKGLAKIPLSRGSHFQIYYEAYGNGIHATNIPSSKILTWAAFDAAIEVIAENGGKAVKGQAMKAKLGEPDLSLHSVEGYVAYKAYNVKEGESALRLISALSAILEWAGLCRNGYGYLELI